MGLEVIFLSLEEGTTNLIFTDSEGHHGKDITTDVQPGDTVKWKIYKGSGISEITSIYALPENKDIFSKNPAPDKHGTSWSGVISETATGEESYGIKYIVDGQEYDVDPIIRVLPRN
ncbi:hypothetical protein [Reichenbachiella sp. MALMAid0571]|uniref:hypothetical protein n=1 Tax=Reichenbachiella sp. MALMAid0571 TaxID=3143939 RepID=UPI0032DF9501